MSFLRELFQWFFGTSPSVENNAISEPILKLVQTPVEPPFKTPVNESKVKKEFDFETRLSAPDVIGSLESLQSLTQQFDRARQDLISELQKLAPPKKKNPFWNKDAA